MTHIYKRRTYSEAEEVARLKFKQEASQNLPSEVIEEMRQSMAVSGGTPKEGWEEILGFAPKEDSYYEIELYKPSTECPYIEKIYARILVGRSRAEEFYKIMWQPELEKYEGPYFT